VVCILPPPPQEKPKTPTRRMITGINADIWKTTSSRIGGLSVAGQESAASMGEKAARWRTWLVAYLAAMGLIHALLLWHARELIKPGYPDFTTFYDAGNSIRSGAGPELYGGSAASIDPTNLSAQGNLLPYLHPPYEGLIFVPLTLLPYGRAYLVWNAI